MKYQKTILLVEDNPDDAELTLRALRKNNVAANVIVARDGLEALRRLNVDGSATSDSRNSLPSFVLLDLKIPLLDGIQVLHRIRANERTRHLPVVILTSSLEPQDIRTAYRLNANSYIRKPVGFVEFTETVRQIGLYWLSKNEVPTTDEEV